MYSQKDQNIVQISFSEQYKYIAKNKLSGNLVCAANEEAKVTVLLNY